MLEKNVRTYLLMYKITGFKHYLTAANNQGVKND